MLGKKDILLLTTLGGFLWSLVIYLLVHLAINLKEDLPPPEQVSKEDFKKCIAETDFNNDLIIKCASKTERGK